MPLLLLSHPGKLTLGPHLGMASRLDRLLLRSALGSVSHFSKASFTWTRYLNAVSGVGNG